VSGFRSEPFVFTAALNDHAVVFQFLPLGPAETDVVLTWLVDGSVREDQVDVERMVWLWDVTTLQDKAIIERNAEGVRSRAYEAGPYSNLERLPARLVKRYLEELAGGA
jgi:phenylpropionate dioxygenase-like ring-hydroxylating dioxygenase large terminal subunit